MAKNKRVRRNNLIGEHWGLDDDGNSILHVAAATGRLDLLQYFYLDRTHRTDINAQNFMGWTPLMQAARFGHFNCVEFLCKYVDIFKRNKYGLTAISLACAHGDLKSVKLLFECMLHFGCNLNDIENPISPLTFSVLFGHTELVQFFLLKSFNIYHQSIRTEITAFDCAKIIHNKEIMDSLQNSRRLSSSNENNFISSTLNVPNTRSRSGVSGSISSLDLSPISPVFLNNDTFILENSYNYISKKYEKSISGGSLNIPMQPRSASTGSNKKEKKISTLSENSTRSVSNNNLKRATPTENLHRTTPNLSSSGNNKKQICISPNATFTIEKSPKGGFNDNSKKRVSPNSLASTITISKQTKSNENINRKSPNENCMSYFGIQNNSVPNNTLKRSSPNVNLQRSTPNLSSSRNSKKQIFFPPDFEIPNHSVSNNSLKRLSPNGNIQYTSPNFSSGENSQKQMVLLRDADNSNRSVNRLSPIIMDIKKKCSPKPITQTNMCTKTVIAQKQQTTTTNYNGNIYQQVTKTYVVQQTTKSPLSINHDDHKMVNTNSNLQLDSKMIFNFDSKRYKCPNESFYKLITILQTNGLGKLVPLFINEEIDYEVFLTLSIQDMIDIGITSVDDHQKILNIISQLLIL